MWDQGDSQEQPWGKVLFSHQWIHTKISSSYSADTEAPSRWKEFMINGGMLPTSMKTPDQLDVKADSRLLHHQPVRRMSMDLPHPLWTTTIKLPILPKWGHMVWGHSPTVFPFAWKSNKAILFYFTQNSVSKFWFTTNVPRSWAFSISRRCPISSRERISPFATFFFYSGWCPPKLWGDLFLLSLLIQMLISSRNILTDTPRKNVLSAIWASLSQSSWHINLTITPPMRQDKWLCPIIQMVILRQRKLKCNTIGPVTPQSRSKLAVAPVFRVNLCTAGHAEAASGITNCLCQLGQGGHCLVFTYNYLT